MTSRSRSRSRSTHGRFRVMCSMSERAREREREAFAESVPDRRLVPPGCPYNPKLATSSRIWASSASLEGNVRSSRILRTNSTSIGSP